MCKNCDACLQDCMMSHLTSWWLCNLPPFTVSFQVDGMDVLAVRESAQFAINHCVSGKGPIILETMTYRYSGHSMSDPGTSYRTREEVQDVRQTRDPITSFKEKIVTAGLATTDELKVILIEIWEYATFWCPVSCLRLWGDS